MAMRLWWLAIFLCVTSAFSAPFSPVINLSFTHAGPMRIDSLGRSQNGAVNKILLGPNRTAYVAAVAGGIWKTQDITVASPRWKPLTDDLVGLFFLFQIPNLFVEIIVNHFLIVKSIDVGLQLLS